MSTGSPRPPVRRRVLGWGCSVAGDLRAALWGALGRGAALREQLPASAMAVMGVRSPRYRGAGSALPFPLYGLHERGSVRTAAPLAGAAVWLRHERAFQEGLRPARARKPEPGGTARGRTHNAPLCRAPGAARQCPHPGVQPAQESGMFSAGRGWRGQDAP